MAISDMNTASNCPCHQCKNRCVGCHANCENYKQWKVKQDKLTHHIRKLAMEERYGNAWMGMKYVKKHHY